jgi:hypothetical protein
VNTKAAVKINSKQYIPVDVGVLVMPRAVPLVSARLVPFSTEIHMLRLSRSRGCTVNSTLHWKKKVSDFPAREILVGDIAAEEGKIAKLFYSVIFL